MGGVMNGSGNCVEKTLIGIGGEIHRDVRRGSNRAGNLYVQHHLAVGSVRIAGRMILSMVDRYGHDLGTRNADFGKILLQVRRPITTSELNYADAFSLTVAGGEVVKRRQLDRRKRVVSRAPMNVTLRPAAEMRSRLRAIIEAEKAFNFTVDLVWQMNRPSAASVRAALMFEL